MGKTYRRDEFRRPKKDKGKYKDSKKFKDDFKDDYFEKKKKIDPQVDVEEIEDL
jgi:hypothetical protein